MKQTLKFVGVLLFLAGLTGLARGAETNLSGTHRTITQQYAVEPGGKLVLDADRGSIELTGKDQGQVEIVVEEEVKDGNEAQAAKLFQEHVATFAQAGPEIRVEARSVGTLKRGWSHGKPSLNVHYRITTPKRFDVSLATAGGNVQVTEMEGAAEARTGGGKLDLSKIKGSVVAKTSGGNLYFADIQGPVDAHTSGGSVHATACSDKLLIHTSGGNIEIQDFAGPFVQAETSGGAVSADLKTSPTGDCTFKTSGGNITIKLPETSALNVDATTSGGRISTLIPVTVQGEHVNTTLKGTMNGGGHELLLKTGGGNILIEKR